MGARGFAGSKAEIPIDVERGAVHPASSAGDAPCGRFFIFLLFCPPLTDVDVQESLCAEYAAYFRDKSFDELDELARSFEYDQCVQRERLNGILKAHRSA
jgi:hypothetical protein